MQLGLQAYLAESNKAVELYQRAFNAKLGYNEKNQDETYFHAEIVLNDQTIISVSESDEWAKPGMNMQFSINFGKENKEALIQAYEVLKEGGQVRYPLGPCDWNECMTDLTDKLGVRWYLAL